MKIAMLIFAILFAASVMVRVQEYLDERIGKKWSAAVCCAVGLALGPALVWVFSR